ncbi:hypothetical protein HDU96_001019 [Phlyctochytrium bullatum]|nr:hypothetical protein HDU96_001019 [Phlyctochytrium bullatum]
MPWCITFLFFLATTPLLPGVHADQSLTAQHPKATCTPLFTNITQLLIARSWCLAAAARCPDLQPCKTLGDACPAADPAFAAAYGAHLCDPILVAETRNFVPSVAWGNMRREERVCWKRKEQLKLPGRSTTLTLKKRDCVALAIRILQLGAKQQPDDPSKKPFPLARRYRRLCEKTTGIPVLSILKARIPPTDAGTKDSGTADAVATDVPSPAPSPVTVATAASSLPSASPYTASPRRKRLYTSARDILNDHNRCVHLHDTQGVRPCTPTPARTTPALHHHLHCDVFLLADLTTAHPGVDRGNMQPHHERCWLAPTRHAATGTVVTRTVRDCLSLATKALRFGKVWVKKVGERVGLRDAYGGFGGLGCEKVIGVAFDELLEVRKEDGFVYRVPKAVYGAAKDVNE